MLTLHRDTKIGPGFRADLAARPDCPGLFRGSSALPDIEIAACGDAFGRQAPVELGRAERPCPDPLENLIDTVFAVLTRVHPQMAVHIDVRCVAGHIETIAPRLIIQRVGRLEKNALGLPDGGDPEAENQYGREDGA